VPVLLVVGAGGFIGRHVTVAARALPGMRVVGAGRGSPPPAFAVGPEGDWLAIDLLQEPLDLTAALRNLRPDALVNCAGTTTGTRSELVASNVVATAHLLESLERSATGTRLVHIGSAAEYGPGEVGVPVTESADPRPVGPYGISKLCGTQLVTAAARAGKVEAIVLRVFNALGPGMAEDSLAGTAFRRATDALASGTDTIRMGPLDAVRDFVDVRDVAAAVVAAGGLRRFEAPIVNIGSGMGHSARELVQALAAALGFGGAISEEDEGSPRSAEVPWQVADRSLAGRILAWGPAHHLGSTVEFVAGAGIGP
jgi:NDP-hexose 4-ketoreductase